MLRLSSFHIQKFLEKKVYISLGILGLLITGFTALLITKNEKPTPQEILSPLSETLQERQEEATPSAKDTAVSDLKTTKSLFHILILGIDRRYAQETSFRSDVNLLLSFSADRKKVLLTSIPRDLWLDGSRVNAFITTGGPEAIKEKIKKVTGFTVDRYVQIDFDAFVEVVDAVGGIEVVVERSFTDYNYPDDRSGNPGTITVEFKAGSERLDGEKALIFARSRKGDNGEGSDFMRARRQHQILKALPRAFLSPKSAFNPFKLEDFYRIIKKRVKTDLLLEDVGFLYELLQTHGDIKLEQIVLDHEYLYNPPSANYGGAYVLRPKDESFEEIKRVLGEKLQ